MKFKLSIYSICTLLALLAASCTREPLPEPAEQEGEIVTIRATIPAETRVAYTDSDIPGSGGSLAWQTGDQLLLAGYDGTTYIGSSILTWDSGDAFSGSAIPGATPATTYKVYYPGNIITLDDNGEVQLPANFWQQTQDGNNTTAHLRNKLFLSDTEANALNQIFNLTLQSSIIRFVVTLPATGSLKKLIWTVETVPGEKTRSAILDLTSFDLVVPGSEMTVYLAFDPAVMKIGPNGKIKITLIGNAASFEWSTNTTKTGGMTYEAGKRYYATITGGWTDAKTEFRFTIKTDQASQLYEIWQKESSSTSPANLTINWGDGKPNTTIQKDSLLAKTIASHTYDNAGNYTITIASNEVEPSVKQMPQIIFYNGDTQTGDNLLTSILDPFPNMGATDFGDCFFYCNGLTSIPTELFKYNTQADNFNRCFAKCSELTSLPAELFKYNTQAQNFMLCFGDCNGLTSIPADLFRYNTQAEIFSSCFVKCSGLTSLPADLFRYNTQVTNFSLCFGTCGGLTSLPADLFRYNTQVTNFGACFMKCIGLTTIPADLFKYNTKATNFAMCFNGCIKLKLIQEIFPNPNTNADFFAGKAMDFRNCFKNIGTYYTTPTGIAPKLWGFNGGGRGTTWTITDCFTGANVVNRNVIPKSWGGDLADLGNVTNVDGEDW
ncbi:MAG TPA: hypothetical protein PL115_06190 [Bacteroidales bacterium]|jgi:hypothetical protein|nr:hypothetical protein [Bacteroidales bacterium]HKM13183.1 hypothetical protein [Bacteroidales bacterium]HPY22533.1 hypothetical protein [Bacteroidales bacterium]HQA93329.1 hypothetical protein [Bacteroidales bacterium]HQN23591.1 hypothetical protein [Bacteroidales bacterium]